MPTANGPSCASSTGAVSGPATNSRVPFQMTSMHPSGRTGSAAGPPGPPIHTHCT
jgi:hypothetical protein